MRRLLSLLCLLLASALPVGAELRVVATIPDLADAVRQVAGDRVRVDTLARGTMNIHSVPLRPSALIQLSKADVFVQMGLSLEHAFVPGLLLQSRNDAIQPGAPGFVNCSVGWEPIQIPGALDRSRTADIHPEGNPHFNLDPRAGRHLAERVLAGLLRVDPEGKELYEERFAAYAKRLDQAEERWAKQREKLADVLVVSYHNDFTYFARAAGMEVVDTIEPNPGVPPAPRDLADTIALMREREVKLVVTAKWSNNKNTRFVAEKTGARVLEIPVMVDGVDGADTWIGMMDLLHRELVAAVAP